jgi:hypothetical protein
MNRPADPYGLIGTAWPEESPEAYLRAAQEWLNDAEVHGEANQVTVAHAVSSGEPWAREFHRAARGLTDSRVEAETTASLLSSTAAAIIEARQEMEVLCREGTAAIAATRGNDLIADYRRWISEARTTYDRRMAEITEALE